jgi:thioredoxin-related protein
MKIYHFFLPLFCALVACQHQPAFTIQGHIQHANDQTLYLEHTALLKTTIIDSCVLTGDGNFHFKSPAPTYPDFYRLRIGKQSLLLAIDSTETIEISTTLDSLADTKSIEGSESSRNIALLRAYAQQNDITVLRKQAQQLIISNPRSLAAYYAVFFKQNGEYIWNIYDYNDRRMFQAVATSFNTWMPQYERTKALYAQVNDILKATRNAQQQLAIQQMIDNAENAFLDISLSDEKGTTQSLSQFKGKTIILDFSAIEMEQSQAYIFELRDLYNQYHARGLEIYSISLDRNKLLWEDGVENLPWINVYAGERAIEVLSLYNVHQLPTLFLFDKQGNVQGRYTDFNALESDIKKYL